MRAVHELAYAAFDRSRLVVSLLLGLVLSLALTGAGISVPAASG